MSKTSTEIKRKYNQKTYSRVAVYLPKEMVANFKEEVKARGDTIAELVRTMIKEYLNH